MSNWYQLREWKLLFLLKLMMYGIGVRKRSVKGLRVDWVLTRSRTAWRAASLRTAIPGATDPATFLPNSSLSWDLSVYPLSPSGLDWSDIHRANDGHRYILAVAWVHTACTSEVIGAAISTANSLICWYMKQDLISPSSAFIFVRSFWHDRYRWIRIRGRTTLFVGWSVLKNKST